MYVSGIYLALKSRIFVHNFVDFLLHLSNIIKGETDYYISVSKFLTLSEFLTFNQSLLNGMWLLPEVYQINFLKMYFSFLGGVLCREIKEI